MEPPAERSDSTRLRLALLGFRNAKGGFVDGSEASEQSEVCRRNLNESHQRQIAKTQHTPPVRPPSTQEIDNITFNIRIMTTSDADSAKRYLVL